MLDSIAHTLRAYVLQVLVGSNIVLSNIQIHKLQWGKEGVDRRFRLQNKTYGDPVQSSSWPSLAIRCQTKTWMDTGEGWRLSNTLEDGQD